VHVQNDLLELFPQYIGDPRTGKPRVIPFLPGKKLFGRSSTHYVADARLPLLNKYCRALCEPTLPKDVREAGDPSCAHACVNRHIACVNLHTHCSALLLSAEVDGTPSSASFSAAYATFHTGCPDTSSSTKAKASFFVE
jgi:hypothetical protein